MKLIEVNKDNYQAAIEIQRSIFPNEDGALNIIASVNRELFQKVSGLEYPDDHVKYFLAELGGKYIGITGIYYYNFSPDSAWIAWYGILKEYRNQGLGKELLEKTERIAKNRGFKNIRLYTDYIENQRAIKVYEKAGFVGEKYTAERLAYDCRIYSKSLIDSVVPLWNNRKLDLEYQSSLDQMNPDQIEKTVKEFERLL